MRWSYPCKSIAHSFFDSCAKQKWVYVLTRNPTCEGQNCPIGKISSFLGVLGHLKDLTEKKISLRPSVRPSVRRPAYVQNFNVGLFSETINARKFKLGMSVVYDKSYIPCKFKRPTLKVKVTGYFWRSKLSDRKKFKFSRCFRSFKRFDEKKFHCVCPSVRCPRKT